MNSKHKKQASSLLMTKAKPDHLSAENLFQLAVSFHQQQRFQDATKLYESVLLANSAHADAWHMRGLLCAQAGENEKAVELISKAIELNGTKSAYFNNRGLALQKLNCLPEAMADFQKAIALEPGLAEAHCNQGNVLMGWHRHQEALGCFDRAIEIQPDYADAYFNRGNVYAAMLDIPNACQNYDQALALNPNDVDVKFSKGNALLLAGEYFSGWHLYESRLQTQNASKNKRQFSKPLWLGDNDIGHKTILIHAEQGLGDTLQFIRYVPMVAALGATVVVEVQAPLLSLFQNMQGISVLLKKGDLLPPFDFHCPMMSLPLAFKTRLDTIPACTRFITSQAKKQYWADKSGSKVKPLVGLVWSGGFHPNQPEIWEANERRNLPLHHLRSLSGIEVEFISLQKGEPAESEFRQAVAADWDGPLIHDHVHELKDFSDTAALVMNLDLVIAVDTSTAHLAASLGKPVWLLNRYDTCWRWLLDREDSLWYPSLKIYRQPSIGDWDTVMQRVRQDLLAWCAEQH